MKLNNKQKKYIRKRIRSEEINQISLAINVPEKKILEYLKKIWSEDKYAKLGKSHQNNPTNKTSITDWIKENKIILFSLILVSFFVYANSMDNAFVSDDIPGILNNSEINKFESIFSMNPVGTLQKIILYTVHSVRGLDPTSYRLVNILFHTSSVLLIYFIFSILLGKRASIITSALFAVHPILTESVAWISGMPYTVHAFFFLLSFYLYIIHEERKNGKKLLFWSYFFFFITLISLEKAMSLFLVFILYEYLFENLKQNWKKIIPFFVMCIGIVLIYIIRIGERTTSLQVDYYQDTTHDPSLLEIPVAIVSYLKLIFWPDKLSLYQTEMDYQKIHYYFIFLIFFAFVGMIIYSFRRSKLIFFSLSFFITALSPSLLPLGISWIVAERYVYLGSIGIFVVMAILFDRLLSVAETKNLIFSRIIYGFLVVILLTLSVRTIVRNNDWQDEDHLWVATAKTSPSGFVIHNNLGDVYSRQGDLPRAIEEFSRAIEINPQYANAFHNRAHTYYQMGQVDKAIEDYKSAIKYRPTVIWQAYKNLAVIYYTQRKMDLAHENINKALEINPNEPELHQIEAMFDQGLPQEQPANNEQSKKEDRSNFIGPQPPTK